MLLLALRGCIMSIDLLAEKADVARGSIETSLNTGTPVVKSRVKLLHGVDDTLWNEVQAQARLEGIGIKDWVEEALRVQLGSEQRRRKRLPEKANCEMCGRELVKDGKAKNRFIVHHDVDGNRGASVAIILCDKCHKHRHKQLGWGVAATFHCRKCKKRLPMEEVGFQRHVRRRHADPGPLGTRPMKIVRVCKECAAHLKPTDIFR